MSAANVTIVPELAKAESKASSSNDGPVKGSAAAIAQSIQDKQDNLAAAIKQVTEKSTEDIAKEDAKILQSAQDRLLGQTGVGTLASETQKQADINEAAAAKGVYQTGEIDRVSKPAE